MELNDEVPAGGIERLAWFMRHTSAARGVDMYAIEVEGLTASEWAELTDRNRSTVSRNYRRGNEEIVKKQEVERRKRQQEEDSKI